MIKNLKHYFITAGVVILGLLLLAPYLLISIILGEDLIDFIERKTAKGKHQNV